MKNNNDLVRWKIKYKLRSSKTTHTASPLSTVDTSVSTYSDKKLPYMSSSKYIKWFLTTFEVILLKNKIEVGYSNIFDPHLNVWITFYNFKLFGY